MKLLERGKMKLSSASQSFENPSWILKITNSKDIEVHIVIEPDCSREIVSTYFLGKER